MTTPTPFLLTGVTGGLGAKILDDMLNKHKINPASIIATSRSECNREKYKSLGLHFRLADYKSPSTLTTAFQNVRDLFFMSSSERNSTVRNTEHANVIAAARAAHVSRVWYVSLAFGGWDSDSKIGFQQAHYETERLLAESGMEFVSLRAGVYSDAFPLFLNWYPESEKVMFPKVSPDVEEGRVAFTSREELGEGIATVLVKGLGEFGIKPRGERRIVLLTAGETNSMVELVSAIDRARPGKKELGIEYLEPEAWIEEEAKGDLGGKGRAWFEARLVFAKGVCGGDAEVTDSALERLLGRAPETGSQAVERLVREAKGEYRWHQNHVGGRGLKGSEV